MPSMTVMLNMSNNYKLKNLLGPTCHGTNLIQPQQILNVSFELFFLKRQRYGQKCIVALDVGKLTLNTTTFLFYRIPQANRIS